MRSSSPIQSIQPCCKAVNRECDSLAREVRTLKGRQEEGVGAVSEVQGRLSRCVIKHFSLYSVYSCMFSVKIR
jgi:hypothetical protein